VTDIKYAIFRGDWKKPENKNNVVVKFHDERTLGNSGDSAISDGNDHKPGELKPFGTKKAKKINLGIPAFFNVTFDFDQRPGADPHCYTWAYNY
jgi:hypothetical protein